MSRKLAVVISGAVSLGSYEAGVIYEVLEVIARYNEKYIKNDNERIEIDVITGASAGGMTACLLAQHLLCSDKTLRDPYKNPLYEAWVKDVDILKLLQVKPKEHMYSLLQSDVVEQIGEKYIKDVPKITPNKHPAAASEIQIGVAMSNLNGYDYKISKKEQAKRKSLNKGETEFGYTRYKDQFVCVARRSGDEVTIREKTLLEGEEKDVWEEFRNTNWGELRTVGLSSGAFPFAFRAMKINRDGVGEFKDREELNKKNRFSHRTGDYWYVDGGVFENEPIGMAQELVAQIDKENPANERFYLYIAPGNRKLSENPFLKEDENGNLNLLQIGGALTGSIFQQARFQDWIIEGLEEPIFSITASNYKLLGDVFSAFAGFLEEKFRAYDYNIGRERAREDLKKDPNQDLESSLADMPDIEWKVDKNKSLIKDKTGTLRAVTSWKDAKKKLEKLARPEEEDSRDQIKELKRLMSAAVDLKTRQEILNQLISRLDSLIIFINNKLDPLDKKDRFGRWIKYPVRKRVGEPLTKLFLKRQARIWLKRNILDLR